MRRAESWMSGEYVTMNSGRIAHRMARPAGHAPSEYARVRARRERPKTEGQLPGFPPVRSGSVSGERSVIQFQGNGQLDQEQGQQQPAFFRSAEEI